MQNQAPNIDFKQTTPVEGFNGEKLFGQAVIIRKISKFLIGADEDALIPIPVFYDVESGEILLETLPKELRKEYGGDTV